MRAVLNRYCRWSNACAFTSKGRQMFWDARKEIFSSRPLLLRVKLKVTYPPKAYAQKSKEQRPRTHTHKNSQPLVTGWQHVNQVMHTWLQACGGNLMFLHACVFVIRTCAGDWLGACNAWELAFVSSDHVLDQQHDDIHENIYGRLLR